jgi:hypothetical protein
VESESIPTLDGDINKYNRALRVAASKVVIIVYFKVFFQILLIDALAPQLERATITEREMTGILMHLKIRKKTSEQFLPSCSRKPIPESPQKTPSKIDKIKNKNFLDDWLQHLHIFHSLHKIF